MKAIRVIVLMLIPLLLTACKGSEEETRFEKQPTFINVYVYAPERPIVTRGDIDEVDPIDKNEREKSESKITTLQIWVFNHNTGELIAYYSPESVTNLNNGQGETYQLSASDAFTQAAEKPDVDVYVVANAASCGLSSGESSLGESTTRAALEAALIEGDYFGLSTLTSKVPAAGLPMSGVLRGAPVGGSAPVFKISTVPLTRAVSKIRFIFSREKAETEADNVAVKINSIKLSESMIPTQEYLFLETGENATAFHVGSYGTNDEKEFLPIDIENGQVKILTDICQNTDPMAYSYQANQDAQAYEDLIEAGLKKTVTVEGVEQPAPELTQVGPFYLRESGKQLTGTITFQKDDGTSAAKPIPFEMHTAGDFSRNHTWIVYAYYSVSGLVAVTVVVKDWNDTNRSHEIYNW